MKPEYQIMRCCMCPNRGTPNKICPAGGPQRKPETECRFVKEYVDEDGRIYSIGEFSRMFGSVKFTGYRVIRNVRNIPESWERGWGEANELNWKSSYDAAQAALNEYAKLKGWDEC